MGVRALQHGTGCTDAIGQHLHQFLELDPEGAGRVITAEAPVVLALTVSPTMLMIWMFT